MLLSHFSIKKYTQYSQNPSDRTLSGAQMGTRRKMLHNSVKKGKSDEKILNKGKNIEFIEVVVWMRRKVSQIELRFFS